MFTKQELEFLLTAMATLHFAGTVDEVQGKVDRIIGIREKLELLLADHPVDEEAGKKPAEKKPAAKKPAAKKPAAKKK